MKKKKIEFIPSAQMDQNFWRKFDQEFKAPPKAWWRSLKVWSFSSVALVLILSIITIRHLEKEERQENALLTQYENVYWETEDLIDQDHYALSKGDLVEESETSSEEDFLL